VFIFLAYAFVYLGFTLIQEGNLQTVNTLVLGSFALNALFTMLALPLIYFLERIFGLLTDLSLLELSNTNSPLLRQLALVAPGTFQHSMQVANLSEEALYEIGGDTLLARTGALYHDIGKMENPLYFIENQMGGYNPHDDISSAESARIIIDHVTKGIEKARKAHLPEQIIDFIRTHHGNRRVEYFYFLEQKQNPGLSLDERDFSYHGPIPFSKETAVVMMADSVEAASRSIKTPSEQKLNDLVENIIGKQMETNQFINSNITLKEINTVKKVLKKKLMNIYHVRIAYPD
jgi:putative nucleotidyltransferase with HDIG domain